MNSKTSNYKIGMQEPIRLQATNSLMSYGSGNDDYPSIDYINPNSTYEPVGKGKGARSVDRLRFLNSTGFSSTGSKPDFDQNQMKLY